MSEAHATSRLRADARNRAARTFLQGLTVDVAVALGTVVLASINTITGKAGLVALGLALLKTTLTTAVSYVMRRFIDTSRIPTPLPPSAQPEPARLS